MPPLFPLAPNGWSLFLLIPAAVSLWLAVETARPKYGVLGKRFCLLSVAIGWWCLAYALELSSVHPEAMRFWLRIEYLAIPAVAPLMYGVVREFLGFAKFSLRLQIGVWIIPLATAFPDHE